MTQDKPEQSPNPEKRNQANQTEPRSPANSAVNRGGGTRQDVARLVSQACDDQLNEVEKSRLERMLSVDEGLRSHYVSLVINDALLEGRFAKPLLETPGLTDTEDADPAWPGTEVDPKADVRPRTLAQRNQHRRGENGNGTPGWWFRAATSRWTGLAAILIVTATTVLWWNNRPVATVIAADHAELANGSFLAAGDEVHLSSWFHLKSGKVQIRFNKTAQVALTGPSRFRATGGNQCELQFGALRARVPEKAAGFSVQCPAFVVEDLGTSFSLVAQEDGPCSVHVTDGEVRVISPSRSESLTLEAGQVVSSNPLDDSGNSLQVVDSSLTRPLVRGDIVFRPEHVPSLAAGAFNHNGRAFLFLESRDRLLADDLPVNIVSPGYYTEFDSIQGEIPRGTRIHSYLLHSAPRSGTHEVSGSITLPGEILGIICSHDRMNKTNRVLGADWTLNCGHIHRGLETTPKVSADVLKLSRDRRTLSVTMRNRAIDQIRILVKAD